LSLSFQKYGFGIRDPEKTYSGSRIQGSKGTESRIWIRNTARIMSFISLRPSNRLLPVKDICYAGSGLSEEEKQAYQAEIKSLKERMLASTFQYLIVQLPFLIIVQENGKK
jgi:hypothetical protein